MLRALFATGLLSTILFTGIAFHQMEANVPVLAQEITFEQLQSDYLYQLDIYRKAEDRFELDSAEYYKLNTLASREKAVEAMRPYLEARARVMSTYIVALQFLLSDAQGIDLVAKNQTIDKIEEAKSKLKTFIDTIPTYVDRETINLGAENFEADIIPIVNEAQYRTLTLLAIGRVQRAYDQLELSTNEFQTTYVDQIPNESLQQRIERGMKDVYYQNEQADTTLQAVVEKYPGFYTEEELKALRQKPNYQNTYTTTVSDLQRVYSAMKQSIKFLKELETQI